MERRKMEMEVNEDSSYSITGIQLSSQKIDWYILCGRCQIQMINQKFYPDQERQCTLDSILIQIKQAVSIHTFRRQVKHYLFSINNQS